MRTHVNETWYGKMFVSFIELILRLYIEKIKTVTYMDDTTIQQYEQRQKNINKAQVEYLISLANVLSCSITNLTENI